ncbi:uncharacterized protein LOC133179496 [Saccostrea echinata]|uniref:uncharacterized protein LOC133179496 n=1 Tax=Saccostrea echinata TaxID=191078 RepID=UPI002A834B42|nr:uncharacterized protein LOC133179496 [Saccostrea echinata]
MQVVSKAKPLFFAWKSRVPRNFSKCLCHHHYESEKRTLRGSDNLSRVTYGKNMAPLTFSVINTIQRHFCAGPSEKGGQESQDPTKGQGHVDDPNSSEVSEGDGCPKGTLDFQEVESRQEGLLDEEIEDFYREAEEDEEDKEWVPPVSLTRGKTGVFDIEELVTILEAENGRDICVIKIPSEINLTDHMIIVSAISIRHLRAIVSSVNHIYKQRKHESDPFLLISGVSDPKSEWLAMDIGNAFLHVMMPETRQKYDLEGLWMSGEYNVDQEEEEGEEIGQFEWIKEFRLQREKVHNTQGSKAGESTVKTTNTEKKQEELD